MVSGEGIATVDVADAEDAMNQPGADDVLREPPAPGLSADDGPSRKDKLRVSDDELARRRQEVKSLKEQIAARQARPTLSIHGGLSFSTNTRIVSQSPPGSMSLFSGGRAMESPRQGSGKVSLSPDSPRENMLSMPYARKGHFDASGVPRQYDSPEVESLRAKMGEMEAKLLQTQSQLIKERESTRTAKARLAMEMQTRITSEEQELLRSKTLLEQQLADIQESYRAVQVDLNTEKKERQLCEVEIDRLNLSIERGSLNQTQHSSAQAGSPKENRGTQSEPYVAKIQELCAVNLTLLSQKRSAVKHVVAMTTEISDISFLMQECIDQMKGSSSSEADVMLATENKALLMAQLQAQSKLQLMEAELQACQKELAQSKALLASPTFANVPSAVQQSVDENVVHVERKTKRIEDELSALKKTHAEVMVKWTARIRESELQVDQLSKALQEERERSTAQLADLQDELNSVHQSRISESAKYDTDRNESLLSPNIKRPSRSAPEASHTQPPLETTEKYYAEGSENDNVPLLTLCDVPISAAILRQHDPEVISIKLDMSLTEVENSLEFVQTLKTDLCSALGIAAPRIQVNGLRAGSVIVDIAVQGGVAEHGSSPKEILMDILRQMKDPSSDLMQGSISRRMISVEIHKNESAYKLSIKSLAKLNDTADVNDSTCSTNWIELVEQQTLQLRRQTADLVEAEHLNRGLTASLEEKEESCKAFRQALEAREAEASSLQESMHGLSEKLRQAEIDVTNWKRAFSNLEEQLNEHNTLIKKHLSVSEARADGLQLEKQKLAAELSEVKERYMRASQDSYCSVESAGSVGIIPDVLPAPQATRGAAPPVPSHASPPPPMAHLAMAQPDASNSPSYRAQPTASEPLPAEHSGQSTVDISLNLAMNLQRSFEDHPGGRGGFETQLKHDLARASGLAHASFVIKRLELGSPLVDLTIFPNPSGRGPAALAAAMDLEQQARDPASHLKRSPILCHVQEVTVRSPAHEEYKLTREDNQRLREQVQNLRSQVLKHEGEIEERSAKTRELELQLSEHLRIAKTMQVQVEKSISQLHDAQLSNQELAARLRQVNEELELVQRAKDESARMVGKLSQSNEELEARLRQAEGRHQKACEDKDEALRRLHQVETELHKSQNDDEDRQNDENREEESEDKKFSEANKQIHDLQVQGVQLAQAKVYLEEKLDRLSEMHDKEKDSLARNLKHSRDRLAEMEAQCTASAQREVELNRKNREQSLALQDLETAVADSKRPDSERQREDLRRDQSIAALEARLNQMRSELIQRDAQISKLQEALMTTRAMVAKSKSSPRIYADARIRDESSPRNSLNSSPLDSDGLSPGRILPFGEAFSISTSTMASTHMEDVEVRMPTVFQARAQRSSPPPAAQAGSPTSTPPVSPWDVDACKASTQASRGSIISPPESLMASFTTIGNQDSVRNSSARSVSPLQAAQFGRIPLPDAKPTFPASKQISLFQTKPTYQGELKDGWPHGRGITVWPDGRVYDGHWRKGIFQGKGTCIWSNGDIYEGEWDEGFANGLGIYSFSGNGDIYEGTFKQDTFHGYGVLLKGAGAKFRGCWDHGQLHGWALVICKNGEKIKYYFEKGIPSDGQQSLSNDLYGSNLMAVSEVVKSVRDQTAHIRQMRAAGPDSHVNITQGGSGMTTTSPYNLVTPPSRPANSPTNLHAALTPSLQRSEMIPVESLGTIVGSPVHSQG